MATAFETNQPGGDVMDLEPTMAVDLAGNPVEANHGPVDLVLGAGESLNSETRSLRRSRLGYSALILTVIYSIFLLWILATRVAWRPPANGVATNTRTMSCARASGVTRAPIVRTFKSPGAAAAVKNFSSELSAADRTAASAIKRMNGKMTPGPASP